MKSRLVTPPRILQFPNFLLKHLKALQVLLLDTFNTTLLFEKTFMHIGRGLKTEWRAGTARILDKHPADLYPLPNMRSFHVVTPIFEIFPHHPGELLHLFNDSRQSGILGHNAVADFSTSEVCEILVQVRPFALN